MFYTNGTAVYSLSLNSSTNSSSTGVFCIAKQDADSTSLEAGLNWACGQGKTNCLSIQEGQPCYKTNTLQNHASFAYNDYYHRTKNAGGTCDFGGTATISDIDPSHGSCVFTGSSKSANNGGATPFSAYGPASLESARSTMLQVSLLAFLIPMILMLFQV